MELQELRVARQAEEAHARAADDERAAQAADAAHWAEATVLLQK